MRLDPTRTTAIRKAFYLDMRRRFAQLKVSILKLILEEDAFGLKKSVSPLANQRFKYLDDDKKIKAFMEWLDKEIGRTLLEVKGDKGWEAQYIDRAYLTAAKRVFADLKRGEHPKKIEGAFEHFMRGGFLSRPQLVSNARRVKLTSKNQPRNARGQFVKMRMLETKTREQMKGMTARMKQGIGRILTEELSRQTTAKAIAKRLAAELDLSKRQAAKLVQTEIVATYAESQLDAMEALDIGEVGAEVEFETTSGNPCPQCIDLEGQVFSIEEARGVIPVHPNCQCRWNPIINT